MAKPKKRRKTKKAKRARKAGHMHKGRFARRAEDRKPPVDPTLTLEKQIEALGVRPEFPAVAEPWMGDHVQSTIAAMVEWDRRDRELRDAIRRRDAKRMRDPGSNESGKYGVSPFVIAKGHRVEVAPHIKASQGSEQFPKRIATQRVIDRYKAHGHIDHVEWLAANKLWELWVGAGAEFRVCAGYDPVFIQSSPSVDHIMAKRVDAAFVLNEIWDGLPRRSRGCVRAVVIEDMPAADWARSRGYGDRASKVHGMGRLRLGLQGLVGLFGLDKLHRT